MRDWLQETGRMAAGQVTPFFGGVGTAEAGHKKSPGA